MKKWHDDSFWHRPFIDLWTIPHVIFGMVPALCFLYFGANMSLGLFVTALLALFWEVGETVVGVSSGETFSNKVSDIFVAMAGYCGVWFVAYLLQPDRGTVLTWLLIIVAALIVTSAIGWYGYHLWQTTR